MLNIPTTGFGLSTIARLVRQALSTKRGARREERRSVRLASRARSFELEVVEPRVLLSAAPIDYTLTVDTSFTLSALDATHVQLVGASFNSGSIDLSGSVAGELDISRSSIAAGLFADTITLDLASLQQLTTGLHLTFTGGLQSALFQDKVQLSGAMGGAFAGDFTVESDSAIEVGAGASLDATGNDILLAVSESNSTIGVAGFNFAADATHATVTVLGDLSGDNITLKADSSIDVSTNSLALGSVAKLAFLLGFSTADVDVMGSSHITAATKLELLANSTVKIVADMTADGTKADSNTDAAVATIGITTNTHARISGNAVIDTAGATLTVAATSKSVGVAIGDGTSGGKGATVGVNVITGSTEASIKDSAKVNNAASIAVTAVRTNDATSAAKSTTGGSTDGSSTQESKKQLADNDAQTGGGGSISFAGAVAVGVVDSHSTAFVDSAQIVKSSNALNISSTSLTNAQTRADGSPTAADSGGNVGIGVGIGVGTLHNDAYAGGSGGVTAGSLSVQATTGSLDRKFDFKQSNIDSAKGTIDILRGAHGLRNGDALVYHQTGGKAITGLSDGNTYYAVLQDDGKFKLSSNADGSSPLATLNVTGGGADTFDFVFTEEDSRLGVTAVAGASGGSTSVAGALVINVGISETSATVEDGTAVTITGGGNVSVKAENFIQVWAKATGKQDNGTGTGVGPVFSLNIGQTDTDALLGDGAQITGAGVLTLSASSKNEMDNAAEGAAAGSTAVTPVLAISVANNDTNAKLGTPAGTLTSVGSLDVSAAHQGSNAASAEGNTESGKTGVGISFALAITGDSAIATTARDVTASNAIAFGARTVSATKTRAKASVAGGDANDSDKNDAGGGVNKKTSDNKNFANSRASDKGGKSASDTSGSSAEATGSGTGGGSQKVSVAGAVGITVANTLARAAIPDGRNITAGTGVSNGTVTVKSENNTDAEAVADGSTVQPGVKFDPTKSGVIDDANHTIDLGSQGGLKTGDKVTYHNGGGTSLNGLTDGDPYFVNAGSDGKIKLYDTAANAKTGGSTGLKLITKGSAAGTGHTLDPGTAASGSGVGVGIAVAVNVARVNNEALVGNGSVQADGLIVKALVPAIGDDKVHAFKAEATAGVSGVDTGIAGGLAVNVGLSHAKATIADGATITLTDGGSVEMVAENFVSNTTKATGKQDNGGKVGVGAAIGVNVGMTDTTARVGDDATLSGAKDIKLSASSSNELSNTAEAGGKGKTAVTPSIAVSVSNNDTRAVLGSFGSPTIANSGLVELMAEHEGSVASEANGDTESGDTGVGISLALTISTDSALATTGRDINAGGAVTFKAKTVSANRAKARASVAGGEEETDAGSGGSQENGVDKQVGNQRNAADGKATSADSSTAGKTGSTTDAKASASGNGDGDSGQGVSVAGAIAITVANSKSSATLPDGRRVTAGGSLNLLSSNLTEATAFSDGGATVGEGGTGVGVGVSVNVANVTNEAWVGASAQVTAQGLQVQATMAERDAKYTVKQIDVVDTTADTIFVGMDSGLKTGDKRKYEKGSGDAIGGLSNNTEYYVRVLAGGKIQLYDDEQKAKDGDASGLKDLSAGATGTGHKLTDPSIVFAADPVTFNPTQKVRVLELAEGAQLDTGDAVKYDANGGAVQGGLNTTDTYYVVKLEGNLYQLAASREDADKGKAVVLTDDGNSNQKLVDTTDTFRAAASSGASGGDIGVAGSVAINVEHVHTRAIVGYSANGLNLVPAQVTLTGGDVDITAESTIGSFVEATPTQSSKGASGDSVGVGASFALNIALNDTIAEVENGETVSGSTGHFLVSATNDNTAITKAENGASGGGTQVGAGVAIAVVENTTRARIGSGAGGSITLSGALGAEATHSDVVWTTTKGEAAGDGTAIGASVALNIVTDNTSAELARNFSGGTDISVESTSRMDTKAEARGSATGASTKKGGDSGDQTASRNSEQETNHQSNFATNRASTSNKPDSNAQSSGISQADSNSTSQSSNSSQGGTSVAASVAVNYMNVHNTASVAGSVHASGSGHVKVVAASDADAAAQGLSTSTNTKADTGVAAAVGVNIALVHNTATVGGSAQLTGDNVAVRAEMVSGQTNTYYSRALAGAAAKGTAVGGSISLNYLDINAEATVGASAQLTATGGDIDVVAENKNEIQNVAGGAAISLDSGTGLGIAVAINIVNDMNTTATVQHDAVLNATGGSVHVTADAALVPKSETLPVIGTVKLTSFAAGVAASSGGAAIGGSSSVDVYFIETHAVVEHDAQVTASSDVIVAAKDKLQMFTAAGGIGASSGSAGVGVGLNVGVVTRHTTAHVDQGAHLTATTGDVGITAESNDDITSIAATFGLSSSSAGVAASIGVMVLLTETKAYTEDKPTTGTKVELDAGGDITISAKGDLKALMIAGAVGASTSSAGVGVANTTLVHTDTVSATVGTWSDLQANGALGSTGITVKATSTDDIIALTVAGAAASSAGIAVAPTILVLSETTTASIGAHAVVNAGNGSVGSSNLAVLAQDDTTIVSVAGSVGVGGTAGVAAGADVLSLIKNTNAYMDSGVSSLVDGDISVDAKSSEGITSVAAGIAVGGTAGVGVNAGVHVLNITTRAFIGDDPDAPTGAGAGSVRAQGAVRISADDNTDMDKFVATVAIGGSAGVGAAATVTVANKTTKAFIGNGAAVTADGKTAGLLARTGGFSESFTSYVAPKEFAFAPAGQVNTTNDTINLGGSSGFVTGDYVTYHKGLSNDENTPNQAVAGLQDGRNYYLRDTGGGNFALYDTKEEALAGTTPPKVFFDPSATSVDLGNDTVKLGTATGLADGDAVLYKAGNADNGDPNTAIGGLENGKTYYVRSAGGGAFKLYDTKANALAGTATGLKNLSSYGSGTGHSLGGGRADLTGQGTGSGHTLVGATQIIDSKSANDGSSSSDLRAAGQVKSPDSKAVTAPDGPTANPATGVRVLTPGTTTVTGLSVTATNRDDIATYSAAVGGGTVGVAVAAAVNVVNTNTKASIDGVVNANQATAGSGQSVLVAAGNDFHHVALAAGAGFGAVGVAPGVDVSVIANDTGAAIGTGANVKAKADVRVEAHASEDILLVGLGIAAGTVGVGGGVSVLSLNNHTLASVGGTVSAGGDVSVKSSDDTKVLIISGGVGAGFVGVGASVGVLVIGKDTQAFVADSANVDAKGGTGGTGGVLNGGLLGGLNPTGFDKSTRHGVIVQAESSEQVMHFTVAAGGGFVGVSGAIDVSVIGGDTVAWIGANAKINQAKVSFDPASKVSVADDTIDLGLTSGLSTGESVTYFKGIGTNGAIGGLTEGAVYFVRNEGGGKFSLYLTKGQALAGGAPGRVNLTSVGTGTGHALVAADAAQGVYVGADNKASIVTFGGAVAGGFVGAAGAINVGVLKNNVNAQIRDNAKVAAKGDVQVNALGIKKIDSFTFSGAGGFVGAAGSVSVWSVGDSLKDGYKGSSDGENQDQNANALMRDKQGGGQQSADQDAAQQGEGASNMVGSQLGGLGSANGSGSKPKSDQRLQTITNQGNTSLSANKLTASQVQSKLAAALPATKGTSASIFAGSQVNAGGALQVMANESLRLQSITGAVGVGAVGVGVAVSVITVQSNVGATAGGAITAGGAVTLSSNLYENLNLISAAGGGGAVGVGASVAVLVDSSTNQARLGNFASVNGASALNVLSSTTQDIKAKSVGAALGAAAVGASFSVVDVSGFSKAEIGDNVLIGDTAVVGSVNVAANHKSDVDSQTYGLAGGAVAGAVNFNFVTLHPTVSASIGANSSIKATGNVSVTADTDMDAYSQAIGVALSIVGSVAGSFARSEVSPSVHAYLGGGDNVNTTGGNVTVRATHNQGKATRGARATAFAGSGGALLGASGAIAWARSNANVEADAASTATITAGQTVEINADATQTAKTWAAGVGGGFVGIGLSGARSEVKGSANAHMDGTVNANVLNVKGNANSNAESKAAALAGGLIAVSFNYSAADIEATATARLAGTARVNTSNDVNILASASNTGRASSLGVTVGGIAIGGMLTTVEVGKGDTVDEVVASMDDGARINNAGTVTVSASNANDLLTDGQSAGGGAITVTGSDAKTTSDQTAATKIGIGAVINARGALVQALNTQSQDSKSDSVSVGLASGGGALATNKATGDARVDIANGASVGSPGTELEFAL